MLFDKKEKGKLRKVKPAGVNGRKKRQPGKAVPGKSGAQTPVLGVKEIEERIRKRAYQLYEKKGGVNGQDWEDWFKAETIVLEEMVAGYKKG